MLQLRALEVSPGTPPQSWHGTPSDCPTVHRGDLDRRRDRTFMHGPCPLLAPPSLMHRNQNTMKSAESSGCRRRHSDCFNWLMSTTLAEAARRADQLIAQGRGELVRAVRQASAAGMTQA